MRGIKVNKEALVGAAFLLVLFAVALTMLYYDMGQAKDARDTVKAMFQEYNVNLTPVTCKQAIVKDENGLEDAYACTVDATIQLNDQNINTEYVARGKLLVIKDGNQLLLFKLEPWDNGPFTRTEIPDYVAEALSKVTLVFGNHALCTTKMGNTVSCYFPTNKAPIGNATIVYAPLIDLEIENNQVSKVIVHV